MSESPGRLGQADANSQLTISSPEACHDPKSSSILIVDDEPSICEILARWLRREGYVCRTASSAEEALRCLSLYEFALLVSDIRMPGKSGLELLSLVRERFDDSIGVIMVTGVDDRKTAIHALELGAYGYIVKPFDENEVIIQVACATERRRLTLQSRQYEHRLEQEVRERTAEVRKREAEIILRLMSASEYRDDETGSHIRRIGLYAATLAEVAGWNQDDVNTIRLAGTMHDIGKIGVPDSILLKPGKLTSEEFDVVKTHSEIGARILSGSNIPLLAVARDIALSHHEKWDGSGYPSALAGHGIPECARLVAIADVYDALVNDRVYRPALPEEEAIVIMTKDKGLHFDPDLFECFLVALPEFRRIRGVIQYVESQSSPPRS